MQYAPYSCLFLNKIGFSRQIVIKVPSIKFRENPYNGSRADTCADSRTDRIKLRVIGAFCDYAKKPYN
jgi:hypothetical protein